MQEQTNRASVLPFLPLKSGSGDARTLRSLKMYLVPSIQNLWFVTGFQIIFLEIYYVPNTSRWIFDIRRRMKQYVFVASFSVCWRRHLSQENLSIFKLCWHHSRSVYALAAPLLDYPIFDKVVQSSVLCLCNTS